SPSRSAVCWIPCSRLIVSDLSPVPPWAFRTGELIAPSLSPRNRPPTDASQATVYLHSRTCARHPATTQNPRIVLPVAAILSKNQDDAKSERFHPEAPPAV